MEAESARLGGGHGSAMQPTVGRLGRALSLAAGIALMGAGSVSVFMSNNGAGSVGLLVGGILILLVGMTGEPPTRLRMGDKELVFRELKEVRGKVEELTEKVSELFLSTMADSMYENLEKLESGQYGKYKKCDGLRRELIHLRDIGYIDNIWYDAMPDEGPDLSSYVTVTDVGRRFVELRQSLPQH